MPDCDYCGSSFDDDDEYLRHLGKKHYDDLSNLERKRVDDVSEDEDSAVWSYVALGAVGLVFAGIFYFLIFGGGGGGNQYTTVQPGQVGTAHVHGNIDVVIDGQEIDFSRSRYQLQDRRCHFEGGGGERWHVHATDVTLGYGMSTLGIMIDGNEVTFDGETYTNATVEVNGRSVDASSYVLNEGDQVRIVANGTA